MLLLYTIPLSHTLSRTHARTTHTRSHTHAHTHTHTRPQTIHKNSQLPGNRNQGKGVSRPYLIRTLKGKLSPSQVNFLLQDGPYLHPLHICMHASVCMRERLYILRLAPALSNRAHAYTPYCTITLAEDCFLRLPSGNYRLQQKARKAFTVRDNVWVGGVGCVCVCACVCAPVCVVCVCVMCVLCVSSSVNWRGCISSVS